jgi:hypothetical protein
VARTATPRLPWRFLVALVVIAALAQACGGSSSQNTGASGSRLELHFSQVSGTSLGLLPAGCQSVDITIQPENKTISSNDTRVSVLLPAGPHTASAVLHCNNRDFPSDKPDPAFVVPPGLRSIDVAVVFGRLNTTLSVQVSGGIQVTGDGITCPGDCSQTFFTGTSVTLTANQPTAVFSGGCSGTGSCVVVMNADKTVFVGLGEGSITVSNPGCCNIVYLIDGVFVADLTNDDPPVTKPVPSGGHSVRGLCFGEGDATGSPKGVNVPPGGNVHVSFNCD